jgi:DNA-binding XRE family transcriptional regulator
LRIQWKGGDESRVDVSGLVETFRVYEPLRSSPDLFRQVRLGEFGADLVWTDAIDMAADTLWRLAQEQSGVTMSSEAFRRWRERKAYTLDTAAQALGLSRRMVAYYEQGAKPIPRVVALATVALEMS